MFVRNIGLVFSKFYFLSFLIANLAFMLRTYSEITEMSFSHEVISSCNRYYGT